MSLPNLDDSDAGAERCIAAQVDFHTIGCEKGDHRL